MSQGGERARGTSWSWTPGDYPKLPDRVNELETIQERLERLGERGIRLLIGAVAGIVGIALQLLYIIVRGAAS